MSSHWTGHQSPSATIRPSPLSPVPKDTRGFEPPTTASQLVWTFNSYDPFAGRNTQESPSTRTNSQAWVDARHPELFTDTYTRAQLPQIVHDLEHLNLTSKHRDALPFSTETSPTHLRRVSLDGSGAFARAPNTVDHSTETALSAGAEAQRIDQRYQPRRRPYNQDEFDGPAQLLPAPHSQQEHARAQALPTQPIHLTIDEQDDLCKQINDILAHCAFHFIAKYQFPVPLERDKPRVRLPEDREWAEWAYLLKRLATKRRIPARVLFENQIKQFVTTLENSITVRQQQQTSQSRTSQTAAMARTPRDDRYMLQMISSGIQVAKILMDSMAMSQLDEIYTRTERVIFERRNRPRHATLHDF